MADVGLSISSKLHSPDVQAFVILANKSRAEAVACVRKYFVVASTARGWCWRIIKGIIAKVLISRPIHTRSQWDPINVIMVPRPRLEIIMVNTTGFISRGRILTDVVGVWAQKLN